MESPRHAKFIAMGRGPAAMSITRLRREATGARYIGDLYYYKTRYSSTDRLMLIIPKIATFISAIARHVFGIPRTGTRNTPVKTAPKNEPKRSTP